MTMFEASNGTPVRRNSYGTLTFTKDLDLGLLTGISLDQEAALREFFQHERDEELAHPERKPWEDARHGEAWAMTLGVGPEMFTYVDRLTTSYPRFIDPVDDMSYGPKSGFITGRRIWPEGDAS